MSQSKRRARAVSSLPIILIVSAFLILSGAVSVLNPLFESTDEIRHYRYVRRLVTRHSLPVQGVEAVRSQSHHPPLYYTLSALASGWVPSSHTHEYQQPVNPFWGYRIWEVSVDNKLQYRHAAAERFPFREGYLAAMIPRWVNVLFGSLTVWLTYRLGRRIWRERPALAWGAAALVALNPQFIYLSSAINNDVVAAALGAAVLLLSLGLVQQGVRRDRLLRLGAIYGLALLAKFHLIAMGGVIALAIGAALLVSPGAGHNLLDRSDPDATGQANLPRRERRKRLIAVGRKWLGAMGIVLALAALLAGWWFARNWWLYGDPTGLNKVNELWEGRPAAGNWWALGQGLPYLWSSLWGRFGYGQIPLPQPLYNGLLVLCVLAVTGYVFRRRPGGEGPFSRHHPVALVLLGVTALGFTVVVVYYILIQPAGPMGRFLFPAFPAMAVLLVEGIDRWPPLRTRRAVWTASGVTLVMGVLALLALGGYLAPAVRYPGPVSSSASDLSLDVRFGDVARMLALDVQPNTLRPGDPLFVTAVWEPLRQTAHPYAVYIHLVDEAGVVVAQRDTWPGLGRAPTTSWQIGRAFADTYRVDLPETAYAPNRATVRVGLYEPGTGRLLAFGPNQEPLGDGVPVETITIDPLPGSWPNALQADFGDEIDLLGYTLEPRSLSAGETFTLTLYWRPRHDLGYDYSVFAQVLDSDWRVWGSQDGAGPGWISGQVVQDVRHITLLPDTPAGSYPVQVGLYHGDSGRLPVIAPQGHYIDDRVLLGPVRVKD